MPEIGYEYPTGKTKKSAKFPLLIFHILHYSTSECRFTIGFCRFFQSPATRTREVPLCIDM